MKRSQQVRFRYQRNIELALVLSLCCFIFVFQGWKQFDHNRVQPQILPEKPVVVLVIPTIQKHKVPPPKRPSMPVESEDPQFPENETISENKFIFNQTVPQPPVFEPETATGPDVFVPHDKAPQPVGGFAAIQRNLVYPEIPRKAGIEGRVIIHCLIDVHGNVAETRVLKSLGQNGCDEAAIAAIESVKWIPARQRDKAVAVWIAIPVVFSLN